MKTVVRRMTDDDITAVASIEKECFSRPWSEKAFADSLHNGTSVFFVSENDCVISGFIGADDMSGEVFISNIAVSETFRRNGVGSALLEKMIRYCEENGSALLTLEVRVSNEPAAALYSRSGFENLGRRKNFYSDPDEDAYIMTKYFGKNDDK